MFKTKSQRIHDFYQSHNRRIAAFLYSLGAKRSEDIEEIMHEVFADLIESWEQVRSEKALLSWALTVARRKFFRWKRSKIHSEISDGCCNEMISDSAGPEAWTQLRELVECIEAVEPVKRRLVLQRFYLEEYSAREISTATGVPISTVTTWCSRFREMMRERQQEHAEGNCNYDIKPPLTFVPSLGRKSL